MKRFLPILLLGVLPSFAHAWWNDSWTYRLPIALDASSKTGSAVAENQLNVPVLVRLHAGNFEDFFSIQENLHDLRFISGDDKTPLDHQVEQFDLVNQILLVWVMLPNLNAGVATDKIFMYYGNASATSGEKPAGIYGVTQTAVVHFEKNGEPVDAAANKLPITWQSGEIISAGIIGKAGSFKADTQLTIKNTGSLLISSVKGATFSAWIKPTAQNSAVKIMSIGSASNELSVVIEGTNIQVQTGSQKVAAPASLSVDQWQHFAWVVKNSEITLFVNGKSVAAGQIGSWEISGDLILGGGFVGDVDEIELANEAKSAEWLRVTSNNQGITDTLIKPQPSEQLGSGGESGMYEAIIGNLDTMSWFVLAAMGIMGLISWIIMIGKGFYMGAVVRDNRAFLREYEKIGTRNPALLDHDDPGNEDEYQDVAPILQAIFGKHDHFQSSPIYHLFHRGMKEVKARIGVSLSAQSSESLSPNALDAIRAALDAQMTREVQKMQGRMTFLTMAVSGGPFLGLLGTVAGVMITFSAIAASGDVNIAAIAPGVAAALVTTVGGLIVAIPAMFGYNFLSGKIRDAIADMRVFSDEYLTKLAEHYGN
jgi:biopolymer transport protein ExbB